MNELTLKLKHYRLNQTEYDLIEKLLGRAPQGVEWALFSALWSEHCSYKSSRVHLKKFFSRNERVVSGPGENAGVIDLGQGERLAFKMESHNHPSFIEPYQGAATGIGGILRDVFTMGARPIAVADYLCFGSPEAPKMRSLVDGVVRGIGGYGNCVGVPNITGQTEFDQSYNNNILVNAMAVGLFRPKEPVMNAIARGPGNLIVYVGAKTGRDGIHGASMASESFDDKNEAKKPTIQKGDPFFEKLLIESCLEVMKAGLVVAVQDMGAAGLTSSSFEMVARGGVGMKLYLDRVPLRDSSMLPEDILLSESQERMLLVCEPKNLLAIQKVFERWDLDAVSIGEVTQGPEVELFWHGENLTKIDPKLLTDHAPKYERPYSPWRAKNKVEKLEVKDIRAPQELLSHIHTTSRKWIYEQYDQHVGGRTVCDASESVGVLRLPDSGRGLGVVTGCRPYLMQVDAQIGAKDAVLRPALELAAKGFMPLAVTDCLNFGNPENEVIMSEFVASIEGMSETCKALNTPVISGNVSFYNETLGKNITSTPATGIVGLRDNVEKLPRSKFQEVGTDIFILKLNMLETDGKVFAGAWDDAVIKSYLDIVLKLSFVDGVLSSRVVGREGALYALSRMCLSGKGAAVKNLPTALGVEALYEVIFEVRGQSALEFKALAQDSVDKIKLYHVGVVRGDNLKIDEAVEVPVRDLILAYNSGWDKAFGFS
jgi:phosphoribosylformylglycinamidine synthase